MARFQEPDRILPVLRHAGHMCCLLLGFRHFTRGLDVELVRHDHRRQGESAAPGQQWIRAEAPPLRRWIHFI